MDGGKKGRKGGKGRKKEIDSEIDRLTDSKVMTKIRWMNGREKRKKRSMGREDMNKQTDIQIDR